MPVDAHVLPFGPTQRLQALAKRRRAHLSFRVILRIVHQHCYPARPLALLRARRERPCRRRAAKQSDEIATLHSITSLARRRNDSGIVRPSALAVVRLMVRSNFVGCSTGMSPGFAPRRILST